MIEFITVFLGLVTGIKPVEFAVSDNVAEVELRLDGEVVGWLREAPWVLECDFGELTTHQLVAIARGPRGRELARIEQLINIPRPNVDSRILLEDWRDGSPRAARLHWHTVEPTEPVSVSLMLDGQILADQYAERYELPDLDPGAIHFLSTRLDFPDSQSASAEVVFGGSFGSSTETELTAIPLHLTGRKLRRAEYLQGRLVQDGEPLRVFALEDGPAQVVVVRDRRAITRLRQLGFGHRYRSASLAKDDAVMVMSPRAFMAVHPDTRIAVYQTSPPTTRRQAPLPQFLAQAQFTRSPVLPQRLTDAVATAGLRAASSQTRRAVVLVTSNCADVSGQWNPEGVRRFLAELRVPFRVWQVEEPAADAKGAFCDEVQPIDTPYNYYVAIKSLRRDLLAQQIVWVEGRHLQRKIELTGDTAEIQLVD